MRERSRRVLLTMEITYLNVYSTMSISICRLLSTTAHKEEDEDIKKNTAYNLLLIKVSYMRSNTSTLG